MSSVTSAFTCDNFITVSRATHLPILRSIIKNSCESHNICQANMKFSEFLTQFFQGFGASLSISLFLSPLASRFFKRNKSNEKISHLNTPGWKLTKCLKRSTYYLNIFQIFQHMYLSNAFQDKFPFVASKKIG